MSARPLFAALALVACGDPAALPSTAAPPALRARPLVPGEPFTVELRGVAPGVQAHLAWGTAVRRGATCVRPRLCLDLVAARPLASAVADASGTLRFTGVLSDDLVAGDPIALQAFGGGSFSRPWTGVLSDRPEVFGAWRDDFGFDHEVDVQNWRQPFGVWHVANFDNAGRWLIAQNDVGNSFFPGLWSRYDWTVFGGRMWMCQTTYAAASEAAAKATPAADPSDPASRGCGGFAWTALDPMEPAIAGDWTDEYGGGHHVDATVWDQGWSAWTVSRFSNLDGVVIAQNDPTNPYSPGMWSRFDWVQAGGRTWYCQTAYDAPSEWAARQTPAADASAPSLTGCGGFAWTELL